MKKRVSWSVFCFAPLLVTCLAPQPSLLQPTSPGRPHRAAVRSEVSAPSANAPAARVSSQFPAPQLGVTAPLPGSPSAAALASAKLTPGSCAATKEQIYRRAAPLIVRMRQQVDAEYEAYRERQPDCWEQYRENELYWKTLRTGDGSSGLGLSGIGEGGGGRAEGIGLGSVTGQGFGSGHGRLGASHVARMARSYSRTNNQVADVDEADLVKTDGRYLYLGLNGALRIVEALQPRVLSVTKLPGRVKDLFVEGDRAVVYSRIGGSRRAECKYAYDCTFMGDGSSTRISVLDISDRSAPKVARVIELSGSLLASRRIGNSVHTVVSDGDAAEPPYQTWLDDLPECGVKDSAVRARVARLKERNERAIREYVTNWAPTLRDRGVERSLCDGVLASRFDDGDAFTTLVSFDLSRDEVPAAATAIRSRPGAVFASADALYVSVAHQRPQTRAKPYRPFGNAVSEVSEVHKFHIGARADETRYIGSGVVPGHVLNQFSMDEWYGYLRIATSRGRVPDPKVESVVSVLAQSEEGNLVRVGAVEHIAPGEDIRAVRFDNDRGYVVTFKKTDPLFSLDLGDPAHPRVVGELKIPGFSTYLQRIDPEHLISIGFDANDHGSFAYYDGLLLQLFDVRAPAAPKLLFREKIGTRGSGSEAATDHQGFNYFAERGVLALPATICGGGGDGTNGNQVSFSGLLVYSVDLQRGFARLGGIDHGAHGANCKSWWSRSSSLVKRSVILDDLVYSIAEDRVKAQRFAAFGRDAADLDMRE